jgi:WD40 repeat protein
MAPIDTAIALDVHTEELYSTFNPDRSRILTGDERDVRIWDSATGQCIGTFKGHQEPIEAVAWSLDQQQVASGSHDSTI